MVPPDCEREQDVEVIKAMGDVGLYILQKASLLLAGWILDFDDVVADFLGEERVPRIGEGKDRKE